MAVRDSFPPGPDGIRRGFPINTGMGTMYVNPTVWGAIVDNSSNTCPGGEDRPYLTVRGRQYTATVGIYADEHARTVGADVDPLHGKVERCYVNLRGSDRPVAPSITARIVECARDAIAVARVKHADAFAQVARDDARMRVESANKRLGELQNEVDRAALAHAESLGVTFDA